MDAVGANEIAKQDAAVAAVKNFMSMSDRRCLQSVLKLVRESFVWKKEIDERVKYCT
jgi:hypothetical protein